MKLKFLKQKSFLLKHPEKYRNPYDLRNFAGHFSRFVGQLCFLQDVLDFLQGISIVYKPKILYSLIIFCNFAGLIF